MSAAFCIASSFSQAAPAIQIGLRSTSGRQVAPPRSCRPATSAARGVMPRSSRRGVSSQRQTSRSAGKTSRSNRERELERPHAASRAKERRVRQGIGREPERLRRRRMAKAAWYRDRRARAPIHSRSMGTSLAPTGCFGAEPTRGRRHRRPLGRPRRRRRHAAGRGCGYHVPTSRVGQPVPRTPHRAWPTAPRAPTGARRTDAGRGRRTRRDAPIARDTGTTPADPTRQRPPQRLGRSRPNPVPARAHPIVRLLRLLALAGRSRSPRCSPLLRSMFGENKNKGNKWRRKQTGRTGDGRRETGNGRRETGDGRRRTLGMPSDLARYRDEHPEGSRFLPVSRLPFPALPISAYLRP